MISLPRNASGNIEVFRAGALQRLQDHLEYRSADPFPHIVIDGLFDDEVLRALLREWPEENDAVEIHDDGTFVRKKRGTTWQTQFGPTTQRLFSEMTSARFLLALESMTGMWGLMGDPYFVGGGLHSTGLGGTLAVHADFNKHPRFALDRRLNVLVYLNEDWTDENGGHLELWDQGMSCCQLRVLPVFNRTVIFSTKRTSFHGQPVPVAGDPTIQRRSIALYYYSNGRADEGFPPEKGEEHSTLWQERPRDGY